MFLGNNILVQTLEKHRELNIAFASSEEVVTVENRYAYLNSLLKNQSLDPGIIKAACYFDICLCNISNYKSNENWYGHQSTIYTHIKVNV